MMGMQIKLVDAYGEDGPIMSLSEVESMRIKPMGGARIDEVSSFAYHAALGGSIGSEVSFMFNGVECKFRKVEK